MMSLGQKVPAPMRYRLLLVGLEVARHDAGGELPMEEELRRIAELDHAWREMTEEEQDDFEHSLVRRIGRAWRRGKTVQLPPRPPADARFPWMWRPLAWPRYVLINVWLATLALAFLAGKLS